MHSCRASKQAPNKTMLCGDGHSEKWNMNSMEQGQRHRDRTVPCYHEPHTWPQSPSTGMNRDI